MTNKKKYQQAFSMLHASDKNYLEEKKMQIGKERFRIKKLAIVMGALVISVSTLTFSHNVYAYTDRELLVFMEEGADQHLVGEIKKEIAQIQGVQSVKYTSADEAWEEFQEAYLTEELAVEFTENPLEDCQNFEIRVLKSMDMNQLQMKVEQINGVRKVIFEEVGK